MANLIVKDAGGSNVEIRATGTGTTVDPFVMSYAIGTALPAGSNAIGGVTQSGTWSVNAAQSGTWNITNISGTISLPTGAATAANQSTTNTNLSTISGQLPAARGQQTSANSLSITPASNAYTFGPGAVDSTSQRVTLGHRAITSATGTASSSGDNQIVAAQGAGTVIVVAYIAVQQESSTATTMIFRQGTTAFARAFGQNQGDGLAVAFAPGREYRLPANTALNLNLSGANTCGYTVFYWVE